MRPRTARLTPGRAALASLAAALAVMPVQAKAADAGAPHLGGYKHVSWSLEGGAPSRINSITQSRDGYLWIGSVDGLFRFDGVNFEQIQPEGRAARRLVVAEVLAARSGEVWAGLARSGGVAVYRNGRLADAAMPNPSREVTGLAEDRDGAIWVARGGRTHNTLARYWRGRWEEIGAAWGIPEAEVWQIVMTRDGALWLVLSDTVLRRAPGARRFEPTGVSVARRASLAQDARGLLWVSDSSGTRLLSGAGPGAPARRFTHGGEIGGTRIIFDRRGDLWGATWTDGVFQIPAEASAATRTGGRPAGSQKFMTGDGLTSDQTHSVFQDREGDLWIGTELGLDMLRPASVVAEPTIPADSPSSYRMTTTQDGVVYVSDAHTVYAIQPGARPRPVFTSAASPGALCPAVGGGIWIMLPTRVVRLRAGRAESFPKPFEASEFGCAEDRAGRLWVPARDKGLYWRKDGGWRSWSGLSPTVGVPANAAQIADGRAAILFRTAPRLAGDLPFEPLYRERFRIGGIEGVLPGRDALYLSGGDGMARLQGGQTHTLSAEQYPWLASVNGLVQTPFGDTWTIGDAGIIRMSSADLDATFDQPGRALAHRTFDFHDGVNSFAQKAPGPQIAVGGDGRVWILTRRNVLTIDPAKLSFNQLPPPLSIRSVATANRRYRDPSSVELAAGTKNLRVQYAALSLAAPSRVRFRYRLLEANPAWTDAGGRRDVVLTDLRPGTFHFQVIAANDDGVWNTSPATVTFTVPPTLTQTWWFRLACAALAALALWSGYAFRLRRLSRQIRASFEVRAAERERIARELHDTLLQGVQGLIMRFQSVADHIPADQPAKDVMNRALDRAEQMLLEGRDSVRDLRRHDRRDLSDILRELAEQQPFDSAVEIEVSSEGATRAIQPVAQDEIVRIAGEALFNAARHANARRLSIQVAYGSLHLQIRIRDDGVGFDPAAAGGVVAAGHYGLHGMRERARKIGAQLTVDSAPGRGSTIVLRVVGAIAYEAPPRRAWPRRAAPADG